MNMCGRLSNRRGARDTPQSLSWRICQGETELLESNIYIISSGHINRDSYWYAMFFFLHKWNHGPHSLLIAAFISKYKSSGKNTEVQGQNALHIKTLFKIKMKGREEEGKACAWFSIPQIILHSNMCLLSVYPVFFPAHSALWGLVPPKTINAWFVSGTKRGTLRPAGSVGQPHTVIYR